MASCNPQTLLDDAGCLNNYNEFQLQVIQAKLLCNIWTKLDVEANCDPQILLDSAECFAVLSPLELKWVIAQLLCEIKAVA